MEKTTDLVYPCVSVAGLKLVGLKYISPGKGSFKVKSYIPDDYKDLVDLAARY